MARGLGGRIDRCVLWLDTHVSEHLLDPMADRGADQASRQSLIEAPCAPFRFSVQEACLGMGHASETPERGSRFAAISRG